MDLNLFKILCNNAKKTVPTMSLHEKCNLIDELDSHWYNEWCEREGTEEELTAYLYSLLKTR